MNPSTLEIGPQETVVTKAERDAAGLRWWPDGTMGVLRQPGPERHYAFIAANGPRVSRVVGDLDDPLAVSVNAEIPIEGANPAYHYSAGGPVYRDAGTGLVLLFYHAEIHPDGDARRFHSCLGMARSSDEGEHWVDLGPILTPNLPPDRADCLIEMQGAPFLVVDDHFYVYFRDYLDSPALSVSGLRLTEQLSRLLTHSNDLAVARAPVAEVVRAAVEDGSAAAWNKHLDGTWSEPGLGGKSSALEQADAVTLWADTAYNEALDSYILVRARTHIPRVGGELQLEESRDSFTYISYAESPDGLAWSAETVIEDRKAEHFYPTVMGLGQDPGVPGDEFYVYYTASQAGGFQRWSDASLVRRRVRVIPRSG